MEKVALLACLLLLATAASAAAVDVEAVALTFVEDVMPAVSAVATAALLIHVSLVGFRMLKRELGTPSAVVGASVATASGGMAFSTKHAMWQEGVGLHDAADSLDLARRSDRFTDAELALADKLSARGMSDSDVVRAIETRSEAMNRAFDRAQAEKLSSRPDGFM